MADPRTVLGVDRYATIDECRKAYRALARKHHPDVDASPGATKRMVEITRAWELVQKLPQPSPPTPAYRPPERRGRGTPPRPYAGMSDEGLRQAAEEGINAFRRATTGDWWSSNDAAAEVFMRARRAAQEGNPDITQSWSPKSHWTFQQYMAETQRQADELAEEILRQRGAMPTWPDGSLKVTAADFTGDACDFRMPGGLYEGHKLGDILRDHEWYGEEIDQYPIGDPIRGLFRDAKRHFDAEKRGRPIHEW
jgi:alkanesulfonate monooxygenase SsuD/methylene tetrahydromethanopterin reductase-like flavin-dependent oxidoreductase (luciferase family)